MVSRISPFPGKLFDGRTAGKTSVAVRPASSGLAVTFPDKRMISWAYSSLRLADSGKNKGLVRIEHDVEEGGSIRVETLVIADASFLSRVEDVAPNALGSLWDQPRHTRLKRLLLGLAVTVIPLLLYLVWKIAIPFAADALVPVIPVAWEEKLGEKAYGLMFRQKPRELNPQARKALDEITRRLLAPVKDQPYNFRVYIHPVKIFNAMALPGGIVVVFQGLIDQAETPEELAGVLAHEFQHVLQQHPTRNLARQLALAAVLALMVGDADNVLGFILERAGQLGGLSYTRKMETEADAKGMQMMVAAGIDPRGMVGIFEKLAGQGPLKIFADNKNDAPGTRKTKKEIKGYADKAQEWMEYFSTHPMGKSRIKMLKELAGKNAGALSRRLLPEADWQALRYAPPENKPASPPGKKT